jgi:hypothetical protein
MKKFLTVVGVILALVWVVNNPTGAAAAVHHIMHSLGILAAAL